MFRKILAAALCAAAFSAVSAADVPGADTYVMLTTKFKGPTLGAATYEWTRGAYSATLTGVPGGDGQQWRIVPVNPADPNGYVTLRPLRPAGDQCLGRVTTKGPRANLTTVMSCVNAAAMHWKLTPEDIGYRIQNMYDRGESCLDVINGGPDDLELTVKPCAMLTGQIWVIQASGNAVSLVERCKAAVQGKLSWDISNPDSPAGKMWADYNLNRLCQSQAEPEVTIQCFKEVQNETKSWKKAIDVCSQLKAR